MVLFWLSNATIAEDEIGGAVLPQHQAIANIDAAIAILDDAEYHGLPGFADDANALRNIRHRWRNGPIDSSVMSLVENTLIHFSLDFSVGQRRPTRQEIIEHETSVRDAMAKGSLFDWYKSRMPIDPAYHRLRAGLNRLQDSQTWARIGAGATLQPGDTGERVRKLYARLGISSKPGNASYDHNLQAAVMSYQDRHGLDADGQVGRRTLAHLNVSNEERIKQVRANLARWRQHAPHVGGKRVQVNLPSFELTLYDGQGQSENMRVVIGDQKNQTPLLNDTIEYLVFSPYWDVPQRIAKTEILRAAFHDSNYLQRQSFEILDRSTHRPVSTIDWEIIRAGNFPYRIRQKPGPGNSLGQVKFIFPNDSSIYLHDTSAPQLFAKARRAYSHGCVRVENPHALAAWLLTDQLEWTPEAIRAAMAKGVPKSVMLDKPVPIAITYFTAVARDSGDISFYDDVYDIDSDEAGVMASTYLQHSGEILQAESSEAAD